MIPPYRFDEAEFRVLAEERLHKSPPVAHRLSDNDLNPDAVQAETMARPAAVLVPIVARPAGLSLLLTQRTDQLTSHGGQIAFPGGRLDEGDTGPVAAALREAKEETALEPEFVEPLGFLDTYLTVTGYLVVPVVAIVREGFSIVPHEGEVAAVFEAPLTFLMDPANHQRHSRHWKGKERHYYAMPWQDRYIWGATAGMIRNLYQLMYQSK
jgi:8-oxo-dGTP pyrophosphatase MutT (NUDIX family)